MVLKENVFYTCWLNFLCAWTEISVSYSYSQSLQTQHVAADGTLHLATPSVVTNWSQGRSGWTAAPRSSMMERRADGWLLRTNSWMTTWTIHLTSLIMPQGRVTSPEYTTLSADKLQLNCCIIHQIRIPLLLHTVHDLYNSGAATCLSYIAAFCSCFFFFLRLNIVQEPIDRDKALMPITDDIGRTFFECPYCHKLFGSTSDMNRHLDFHEGMNCPICCFVKI